MEENYWIFGIILFFKNEFSKVIIYPIGMCQTTKGTTIMNPHGRFFFNGIWLRYVCNNVYITIDVCFILCLHLNPFKPCGPLLHLWYYSKVFKVIPYIILKAFERKGYFLICYEIIQYFNYTFNIFSYWVLGNLFTY